MKEFEEIYNDLYSRFNDKAEHMNELVKEIKMYALKKLVKPIIVIILLLTILIFITKKIELLILLVFIPGPLLMYYYIVKGSKIRTTYTHNMDIMDQIYNIIINDGFEGLTYCNHTKGIDKSTYDIGLFEKYEKYYSEGELKGVLNNSNKFEMSYVVTYNKYLNSKRVDDDIHYTFRGYLLLIELNEKRNMQIRIDDKKIVLLNKQAETIKYDYLINNIQNVLKEFKKKNNKVTDCTLINGKMYVRIAMDGLGIDHGLNYILDKENIREYYNGINELICLANELLKTIQ